MVDNITTEYVGKYKGEDDDRVEWIWWLVDKDQVHKHLVPLVNAIEANQSYRKAKNMRNFRLYENRDILGFGANFYSRTVSTDFVTNKITLNVVKSCTDTITSKIAKNRPRPLFLTTKGDYNLKRKAKKLTQYMDGAFDAADVYQVGQMCFLDACVFGTGAMKIYNDNGCVKVERIFIDELVVDDSEGVYGKPRQMHQKKYVHRDILLTMYGSDEKKRHAILSAVPQDPLASPGRQTSDMIAVLESWHLASSPESDDGRHVICISDSTLLDEEYKKERFPFVFMKWNQPLLGFFGTGLADELTGIQIEINKILRNIQRAQHLIAVPRVYLDNSSKIISQHIQNAIGSIIKTSGAPPTFHTPQAMTPEIYNHLERLYQKAYEITGVSLLSATSQKPSGLDSGVALREYNDIETERFLTTAQRWEQFYLDVARQMIEVSRDIYSNSSKLSVKVKGSKFLQTISWKEVDMADDKFSLRVFPTSLLPTTPAGRLAKVQELIQAGFVTKEQGLSLLDFPDIEQFSSLANAGIDDIEMHIEMMIDKGEYEPPEPETNLELAIKLCQSAYLRSKMEGVPEERRELLQRYAEECREMLMPPVAPPILATPTTTPLDVSPLASPEPLPASDLLAQGELPPATIV